MCLELKVHTHARTHAHTHTHTHAHLHTQVTQAELRENLEECQRAKKYASRELLLWVQRIQAENGASGEDRDL